MAQYDMRVNALNEPNYLLVKKSALFVMNYDVNDNEVNQLVFSLSMAT
jgi:hypothetical protein